MNHATQNELTNEQKKELILFAHFNDFSCIFTLLPIELVHFISFFLTHTFSKESKLSLNNHKILTPIIPRGLKFIPHSQQIIVSSIYYIQCFSTIFSKDILFQFGGSGTETGQFNNATGMALSANSQKLYICDTYNRRIQVFDLEGHFLSQLTIAPKDGKCLYPSHISVSKNEHLFISDSGIQVFDENGHFLFKFGQEILSPRFLRPEGIAVSHNSEKLFVADVINNRIQVFTQKGEYLYAFGKNGYGQGYRGICLDEQDNLFVADMSNHQIQVFDEKGNFLFCFGEFGGASQIKQPVDVDVDGDGNVYVCDCAGSIQIWN